MLINKSAFVIFLLSSLFLQSCAQQHAYDSKSILDTTWRLLEINGEQPIGLDNKKPISLRFENQTNRVYGYAGCNNYRGQFSITDNHITLSKISTTRMLCQSTSKQEASFTSHLETITSFTVKNDQLHLIDSHNIEVLTFTSK